MLTQPFSVRRNLFLGYVYIFLFSSFFWYGTWIVFFLKHVNYGELGIIQAVGLLTTLLFEIPTGAITDIIGKRKALFLSAVLTAAGEILVPFFPNFWVFLITGIIIRIGMSFYSGTMDAYMYDSLISGKRTDQHPHVLSKMSLLNSGATGIASIAGGLLFLLNQGFPWYLTFAAKFLCIIVAFFMVEPLVDTEKVDIKNAIAQNFVGFKHLFAKQLLQLSIYIISFGILSKVVYEILDDTNIVEFGLNTAQIGTFYAIIMFVSLPISLFYNKIQEKVSPLKLLFASTVFYAITQLLTPLLSVQLYLLIFTLRSMMSPLRTNTISQLINKETPSKIRATTFSTIELINSAPFVLLSFPIGLLMQAYSAKVVTGVLGVIMLVVLSVQILAFQRKSKDSKEIES